ncbi:MAG: enoyl-ACP reductase FabI [Alphaproteobacteria bacterium]
MMAAILDLAEKKGLIIGIANDHSIAYGCARIFHQAGAELAISYLNDKAEPYVRPLAEQLHAPIIMPCDVQDDIEMTQLFDTILKEWGYLDFFLHSIAFAPKADLQGRITDSSKQGFRMAMDISCHSFIRMAKLAEPLMAKRGGSLLTVTYMGSEQVVEHYGLMGPVKAALESAVRYLAKDLGEKHIRVNALSPSPMKTRAGSGIVHFDDLLQSTADKMPLHRNVDLNDIGNMAAFLVSDLAKNITGGVHRIDGGYEMMD